MFNKINGFYYHGGNIVILLLFNKIFFSFTLLSGCAFSFSKCFSRIALMGETVSPGFFLGLVEGVTGHKNEVAILWES